MEKFLNLIKNIPNMILAFFMFIINCFIGMFKELHVGIGEFHWKSDYERTISDIKRIKGEITNVFKNFKISDYSTKQKSKAVVIFFVVCLLTSNDFDAISQNLISRPCKIIMVDGKETVKIPANINLDVPNILNGYLTDKEGRQTVITSEIELKDGKGYGYEVSDVNERIQSLMTEVKYDVFATDLLLNEEHVAYGYSITEMQQVLNEISAPYIDPKYYMVSFKEDVSFEEGFVPHDEILEQDELKEFLTGNKLEKNIHEVVEGDTLWDLSIANEITVDDLLFNNPELTEESLLQIGDEVVINNEVPRLSVRTYERVNYDDVAPYETTTVPNDTEYITYKKVVTPGVNGVKHVTADIVSDNGIQTDKLIINEEVTTPPVTEVIEVGTMNTPPKKATGVFKYPVSGRISDRFGARGGKHEGIDIANSAGTPIKASDGGVVTFAGWTNGGYGNLVIIDHENGYQTYYGHNSRIDVSPGQRVAQGEVIARMGSTGRSTGNHCHFEVRVNGVPQNPFNYLSQ